MNLVNLGQWMALALLSFSMQSYASNLSNIEKQILQQVSKRNADHLVFLEKVVNQNSGTLNLEGVRATGKLFESSFSELGFKTEWHELPKEMNRAGHLVVTKEFGEGPHIMLIGHLDTVFPIDSPFQTFELSTHKFQNEKQETKVAIGPGVGDMKGGNVVIVAALDALLKTNALNRGKITIFLTGDEEYPGVPISKTRERFIEVGKSADYALNFEGGCPEKVVIGRRGFSSWMLKTSGNAAHSSAIFRDKVGAGANYELARIINSFYKEIRGEKGLTFNVSKLAGGSKLNWSETVSVSGKKNVIAKVAQAEGEIRFLNNQQLERTREKMRKIVAKHLPHTGAEIVFEDGYPAMEATDENRRLLAKLNEIQEAMGLPKAKPFPPENRGAADVSFVAPYVTSMDGLGVCSGFAHTVKESMILDSLPIATQRAAILIHRLMNQ